MSTSTLHNTILMLVDGLRPDQLGPYGNTSFDTPHLNQLAAESMLMEQCIVDTPDVQLGLQGILTGAHVCMPRTQAPCLLSELNAAEVTTVLVSPRPDRLIDRLDRWDRVLDVRLPRPNNLAIDWESTRMAIFFAAAIEALQSLSAPVFLLLDCPGCSDPWDAPYSYREQLVDEGDPQPSKSLSPPRQTTEIESGDPDFLLDLQACCGGQVILLDQLLGILLDQLAPTTRAAETLFCLSALRSYPLGEHGLFGHRRPSLYNESIHVPLLIRWPAAYGIFGRSQKLVQPGSLCELFRRWHHTDAAIGQVRSYPSIDPDEWLPAAESSAIVARALAKHGETWAYQTQAWKYIVDFRPQLFVKPDDVWEYNDVAQLCDGIVQSMHHQLRETLAQLAQGKPPEINLPTDLAVGVN